MGCEQSITKKFLKFSGTPPEFLVVMPVTRRALESTATCEPASKASMTTRASEVSGKVSLMMAALSVGVISAVTSQSAR